MQVYASICISIENFVKIADNEKSINKLLTGGKMSKKTGCLIIHGFGGNVEEIALLDEYLKEYGFETLCPELAGHTGRRRDMSRASYTDWLSSALEAYERLSEKCDSVVIIGFSMGGLIAFNLKLKHRAAALITLNTPIYYWDVKRIMSNLLEDLKLWQFKNSKKYLIATFKSPIKALVNFTALLRNTIPVIPDIDVPIFIAQGLKDDTCKRESADYIYKNIGSQKKMIKYYTNSDHLICQGVDKRELFDDILQFITNVTAV